MKPHTFHQWPPVTTNQSLPESERSWPGHRAARKPPDAPGCPSFQAMAQRRMPTSAVFPVAKMRQKHLGKHRKSKEYNTYIYILYKYIYIQLHGKLKSFHPRKLNDFSSWDYLWVNCNTN